jgi:hypothetical protein
MHKHRIADSLSSSARPPNIIDLMNFIIQGEVRNRTGDLPDDVWSEGPETNNPLGLLKPIDLAFLGHGTCTKQHLGYQLLLSTKPIF